MTYSRLDKLAPLSGAAAVLFMMVGSASLGIYDYLPVADDLVELLSGNSTKIMVAGYLGLFSSLLLLWFSGTIFTFLNANEAGDSRLSMIAFGGCVASGIVLGIGFSAIMATGARVGTEDGIGPAEAVTLYDFYSTLLGQMIGFTLAVLTGAFAVVTFRTAMFPSWFAWVSMIITVGLVTPIGYFVLFFAMVWLFVVSIALYRRGV